MSLYRIHFHIHMKFHAVILYVVVIVLPFCSTFASEAT